MASDQVAQYDLITKELINRYTIGTTAPSAPVKGWTWVDTTLAVPIPKVYDGTTWRDYTPSGGIIMWSGPLGAIPAGWKICDGTLSTPDLRDKFVRGAAAGQMAGATGGADTTTHTNGGVHQHDSKLGHNHGSPISVSNAGTHNSGGSHLGHGTPTAAIQITSGGAQFAGNDTHQHDDAAGAHDHGGHAGQSVTVTADGGHQHTSTGTSHNDHGTHDNKPVYYAIVFIMKI